MSPLPSKLIAVVFPRSPEAKKRKAPPIKDESKNGPAAKKAKPSAESSSSEESSSDDEKEVGKTSKSAVAGSDHYMADIRVYIWKFPQYIFNNTHQNVHLVAKAKVTPAASGLKADSSEKDKKKPAKASVKVYNNLSCCHGYAVVFVFCSLQSFTIKNGVSALRLP